MKYLLLAAAAIAAPALAQPKPEASMFNLKIMEPIAVPECAADPKAVQKYRKAKAKYPNMAFLHYPYGVTKDAPCYKRSDKFAGTAGAPVNESVTIDFPMSKLPEGAKWDSVYANIIDGKVQGIGFNTYGFSGQNIVFDRLKAKFGKPTIDKVVSKQNGFGAKFDSIEAAWMLDNEVMVFFEGTGLRTDYGIVSIRSPAARKQYLEQTKALADRTTPM